MLGYYNYWFIQTIVLNCYTKPIQKISCHFETREQFPSPFNVIWKPIRGELTALFHEVNIEILLNDLGHSVTVIFTMTWVYIFVKWVFVYASYSNN